MKKALSYILIAITVGLGIASFFILPDVVVIQVGLSGQATNTMPKILAVLIPMGITLVGSVLGLNSNEKDSSKAKVLSFAGIAVQIVTLVFNVLR